MALPLFPASCRRSRSALVAVVVTTFQAVCAFALPATSTNLTVSSGGTPVASVVPGSVVALTATVAAGTTPVTAGLVNFCDASGKKCTDIHLLGTAALTSTGKATYLFVPGPGAHSYKAIFAQDDLGLSSVSPVATLTVGPAKQPVYTNTTTMTAESGNYGDYSLTATVVGYGGTAAPAGSVSFLDASSGNAVLATSALGPATAGSGWLMSQTPAVGSNPVSEVTGDFNGDGLPDLALFSNGAGAAGFTILFGKGDGTFSTGPTTASANSGEKGNPLIAGDFNGDGKTDLVLLTNSPANEIVTTFLGNGDGTFTTPAHQPASMNGDGGPPGSVAAADFNQDGKIDLAVAGDSGVTILLGNGDGTFHASVTQPASAFNMVAVGDFNGDGIPDLVANQNFASGGASILLGKGDGTFTATTTPLSFATEAVSVVAGDFNQDGNPDLAFGFDTGVQIFLGNGDGTFTQAPGNLFSNTGLSLEGMNLTAGDFNHDGKLDLAASNSPFGVIDVFVSLGDGTFNPVTTTPPVMQGPGGPLLIVAADFNEDGVPDLALLTGDQLTASILLTEPTQAANATVNSVATLDAGAATVLASYAGDSNYGPTVSAPVVLNAGPAPVTFSPAPGTYSSAQTVTLSEALPGTVITYALAGPLSSGGFVTYSGPIPLTVGGTESILAYATAAGNTSTPVVVQYYLNLPPLTAPVLSPGAGTYPGAQTVTITESVPGATIYYTTNGSAPTTFSAKYAGPITVSSSQTVAAIAVVSGYALSPAAGAQYLIGSTQSSFIYTLAGNFSGGFSGDGGLATVAQLNLPTASVLDAAGNLYVADMNNNVVRKVAAGTGVITTIAGTGIAGYSGDKGPATGAQLTNPGGLALDGAGNLYIGDSGNSVVRKVTLATGVITTFAGNGKAGSSGDGGAATGAEMYSPLGLAFDNNGNLYIADFGGSRIREVAAITNNITTVAGGAGQQGGYSGDGGPATAAELQSPLAVATDSAGNLYIADTYNNLIRKVSNGVITRFAGTAPANGYQSAGYSGDGGAATSAELNEPAGVAVDSGGNLYIADRNNRVIRRVAAASSIISTVAGDGSACNSLGGDGGPATSAALCDPNGINLDSAGNLYIADWVSNRIREVKASSPPPTAQTAAPTFSISSGTYTQPQTVTLADSTPGAAIYVTFDGSVPSTDGFQYLGPIGVSAGLTIKAVAVAPGYLASAPATAVYTVTSLPGPILATVAGDGTPGFSSGGGSPGSAQFGLLSGLAFDGSGNLFFADVTNQVVWEVTLKTGQIAIAAGIGPPGSSQGGAVGGTQTDPPPGVAADSMGNLYISDPTHNVVRKVAAGTGATTIYAGTGQVTYGNPSVGDGGPAASAQLNQPGGLAVDSDGNLYIADFGDNLVRRVAADTSTITTVAGSGAFGSNGDGGLATHAAVGEPQFLALDSSRNLYIAGLSPGVIRKVTASTGLISTVAGNGATQGSSGDGGPALMAEISPSGLAVDAAGNLYISDPAEIREVSATTGTITGVAGNRYFGHSNDGAPATMAEVDYPQGIAFDASGNLYLADQQNFRVREVSTPAKALVTPTVTLTPSATSIDTAQALTITVAVSGGSGSPALTGSVTLSSGSYTAQQSLANGAAGFSLPPGSLPVGANTVTAMYAPDSGSAGTYTGASQSTTVVVTVTVAIGSAVATVTLNPSATIIIDQQAITVTAAVTGASGQAVPTGTLTLAGGSFSSQQPLANGGASFSIPAGAFTAASNTLTASYSGDSNYATASGTSTIMVVPLLATVSTPPPVAPGGVATATLTFLAGSSYSGTINVTCALTASPAGAQSVPTCILSPASVMIASAGTMTTTVTVTTTKASSGSALNQWGGGGVLVLALLIVVPSLRRRKTILLLIACGVVINGCGGGGGASPGPPLVTTPGTTAGNYTFLLTGTDAANAKVTTSASLTITVQ